MEVDIWCIGDLNYFVAVLNSLALICQSGLFQDLFKVGLVLAALVIGMQAIFMENMQGGLPWGRFIVAYALYNLMFVVTANVWVYDAYTLKTMQVSNVPYGVAMAGSVTSKVAHEITVTLEQAFSTPTMLNEGFAAPLQTLLKVHDLQQGLGQLKDGNVQKTLEEYVQKCTFVGINNGQISMNNLLYQENPWQALKFDSGAYTVNTYLTGDPLPRGTTRTCSEAWSVIDTYMSGSFWDEWQGYLKSVFCQSNAVQGINLSDPTGNTIACDPQQQVANALNAVVNVSQNAQYYMIASVLQPVLDNGQIAANNEFGNTAQSIIVGQAREQRNTQWMAESTLFANIIRPLMGFFEGFLYAITPFMALLVAFVPSGVGLIFKFFQMFIWIQMWMPVLAILNHYMQVIMQQKLSSMVIDGLIPLTSIQGQQMGWSNMHDWLATASYLASSTPAISLALIYGGAITMTHLAGRLQHGEHIEPQIAKPDLVRPGAVVGMQPHHMGGDVHGSRATGYEGIDRKVEASQMMGQEVASSESQLSSASQSYRQAESRKAAIDALGSYAMSNQAQSGSGLEASSGESSRSIAAYSAMKGHQFGLDQSETKKLDGILSAGAGGEMSVSQAGIAAHSPEHLADKSVGKSSGLGAKAGMEAQLKSSFGDQRGQKIAESIKSDLTTRGDKSVQAAINEKMSSMQSSGELRQYVETHRQEDASNLEKASQQMDQAQKQYSEVQKSASQQGVRQSVPYLALVNAMKTGGYTPESLIKMDRDKFGGALLPPGKINDEAGWHRRFNRGVTDKDAKMWGVVSTLHQNTMRPVNTPGDKVIQDESRHMLMRFMNLAGSGDASKFKGLVDPEKVGAAGDGARRASMNLPGAGDVQPAIQGMRHQIPQVQGRGAVEGFYADKAAGIRSQQEAQRMEGARGQYDKMMEDSVRELEGNKSYSQTFLEGSMQALQDGGSGSLKTMVTGVAGGAAAYKFLDGIASGKGFSGSKEEASKAWDQARAPLWNHYVEKGRSMGLDDNLGKMYAHGAMQGWSSAIDNKLGINMPQLEGYSAHRTQAIQSRSEYLQGKGYNPEAAQDRAEREVQIAEKAGQTGMGSLAARVVAGEKLFSQTREAGWRMGATNHNLQQFEPTINQAAQRYRMPQELIRSVMSEESSGNPRAVSPKGAMGLMQIMPGTAAGLARKLSNDFNTTVTKDMVLNNSYWNVMAGTKYLRELHDQFGGDTRKAVTAYHMGENAVAKGVSPGPQTRAYVGKVMGNLEMGRSFLGVSAANAAEIPSKPINTPGVKQPEVPQGMPGGQLPASATESARSGEGQGNQKTGEGKTGKPKKNPRIM